MGQPSAGKGTKPPAYPQGYNGAWANNPSQSAEQMQNAYGWQPTSTGAAMPTQGYGTTGAQMPQAPTSGYQTSGSSYGGLAGQQNYAQQLAQQQAYAPGYGAPIQPGTPASQLPGGPMYGYGTGGGIGGGYASPGGKGQSKGGVPPPMEQAGPGGGGAVTGGPAPAPAPGGAPAAPAVQPSAPAAGGGGFGGLAGVANSMQNLWQQRADPAHYNAVDQFAGYYVPKPWQGRQLPIGAFQSLFPNASGTDWSAVKPEGWGKDWVPVGPHGNVGPEFSVANGYNWDENPGQFARATPEQIAMSKEGWAAMHGNKQQKQQHWDNRKAYYEKYLWPYLDPNR